MAIKTTPATIALAIGSLTALMGAKLPVKAAYTVSKLARACDAELETYNAARAKIFTDAGCVVEGTQYVHKTDPTKLAEAIKQGDELGTVECELNALPLDIEQFKDCDVPGNAFYGLDWAMKPEA